MDTRYQVFVSSTYTDLVAERAALINCLLQMKCLPATMERFTAAHEPPWEYIKRVIDESDYYVVIVGGRYGSVDDDGVSFTEKEFDYAVEQGVPVLGFVHADPGLIPSKFTDSDEGTIEKLARFRGKVRRTLVQEFSNPDQLATQVMAALYHQFNTNPRSGWIRATDAPSEKVQLELQQLRTELAEAKLQMAKQRPAVVEGLANGDEKFGISYKYGLEILLGANAPWAQLEMTWNEILMAIGPELRSPNDPSKVSRRLGVAVLEKLPSSSRIADDAMQDQVSLSTSSVETVLHQLEALGQIELTDPPRGKTGHLWQLTSVGKNQLLSLLAIRSSEPSSGAE